MKLCRKSPRYCAWIIAMLLPLLSPLWLGAWQCADGSPCHIAGRGIECEAHAAVRKAADKAGAHACCKKDAAAGEATRTAGATTCVFAPLEMAPLPSQGAVKVLPAPAMALLPVASALTELPVKFFRYDTTDETGPGAPHVRPSEARGPPRLA